MNSFYSLSSSCQVKGLCDIYEKYIGQKKNGVFVEVGAYDGDSWSNTSGLADMGWEGYYIEPIREHYEKCVIRHSRNLNTKVFNLAIGDKDGLVKITNAGQLSSCSLKGIEVFKKTSWGGGFFNDTWVEVNQNTINTFFKNNNINDIDVISIDVEGYELNVINGWDINKYRPKVIIIELCEDNEDFVEIQDEMMKCSEYFISNGYKKIYKDQINSIFVENNK